MNARQGIPRGRASGFTLTELAVVVVILALILGGVVLTMGAMTSAREVEQTQQQLSQAREALVGFFLRNGRFPCPAAPAAAGVESPAGGGVCTNPYNGFLPAATLGIGPTDPQGYLLDAWGNRIRYAVSQYVHTPPYVDAATCAADARRCYLFTTTNALAQVGISNLAAPLPELRVCDVANCGGALDFRAPVVVLSNGPNFSSQAAGLTAASVDELENSTGVDNEFVARDPRPGGPGVEFDDLVIWLSPNILYNRLIAAGAI
jgi:prepilin-type N-terminal cleavage/methylation domain-containing protein